MRAPEAGLRLARYTGANRTRSRKAFAGRTEKKSEIYAYEQRTQAVFGAAELKRFKANRAAWAFFERQPAGYRQKVTWWAMTAKGAATRERRLERLISESAEGRRL